MNEMSLSDNPNSSVTIGRAMFIRVVSSIYAAGYAQGQFDQECGFNFGASLETVTADWIREHENLFGPTIDITELEAQLAQEAHSHQRLAGNKG